MCERVRVCWGGVYGGVGIVRHIDRTPSATSLFHQDQLTVWKLDSYIVIAI